MLQGFFFLSEYEAAQISQNLFSKKKKKLLALEHLIIIGYASFLLLSDNL